MKLDDKPSGEQSGKISRQMCSLPQPLVCWSGAAAFVLWRCADWSCTQLRTQAEDFEIENHFRLTRTVSGTTYVYSLTFPPTHSSEAITSSPQQKT